MRDTTQHDIERMEGEGCVNSPPDKDEIIARLREEVARLNEQIRELQRQVWFLGGGME